MRNLTITRKKSVVASLMKMRIYITDPTATDQRRELPQAGRTEKRSDRHLLGG